MSDKIVRIGGATAFFMDSATAVPQLLRGGKLDYMIFDCLAEGSMGLFGRISAANPDGGFPPDFVDIYIKPYLAEMMAQGVKIVANAGGVNPRGCVAALEKAAAELGLKPRIAMVEGDDLRARIDEMRAAGHRDMFSGAEFPDKILSINAYLGGFPIAAALAKGADIIITGRVVDSAVVLGPLIHEFGWKPEDHDLLSAGTLAGHLLECGAQVTGGTHTDWRAVPDWSNIGSPIAECRADGTFVMTKPDNTGGLVSVGTVAEQLLYEVSDPQAYFVPDTTCDFSGVELKEIAPNRVHVSGARGRPPTATYKVCVVYEGGWRAVAMQPIIGVEAVAKAERQSAALFDRTRRMLREQNLGDWTHTYAEVLGSEAGFGDHARNRGVREVICRMVVDHDERRGAELFAREQVSAISAMAVGTSIGFGGSVSPISHLFSFLLNKKEVSITVTIDGKTEPVTVPTAGGFRPDQVVRPAAPTPPTDAVPAATVPLIALAWGRSGDKGNLFNVAIIARRPEYLPYLSAALTPAAVAKWYAHVFAGGSGQPRVDRYEIPGFHAMNFVLHESLGGGITASPRLDPVAKGMAQQIMEFPVPVSRALAKELEAQVRAIDSVAYAGAA